MSKCTVQDEGRKSEQTFNAIASALGITHVETTKVSWTGTFRLDTFIGNLVKLKDEDIGTYNFLTSTYRDAINKTKKLIAKLKLQDLPIPCVSLRHKGVYSNQQQSDTSYSITINRKSTWTYFFDLYRVHHWGINMKNRPVVKAEEERYLAMVNPTITDTCEAITSTMYHCLKSTHEKTST